MRRILRKLGYYFFPIFAYPFISKIKIEDDGFTLRGKKILLDDIVSVYYRNRSPENNISIFLGGAYFVLTKRGRKYFLGEHYELEKWLDRKLEIESQKSDNVLGYIKRWKRPGGEYEPIVVRDNTGRALETLSEINVHRKWLKVVVYGALVLVVIFFAVFFYLMLRA